MKKRLFLMIVAIAVFITAIGAVKYGQIKKGMAQQMSYQPPPEAVTTVVAKSEQWPSTLAAIGTVSAVHGVTVSTDLPGIVERIAFESGQTVKKGDLLVQLDTRQEQALLAAALAQLELTRLPRRLCGRHNCCKRAFNCTRQQDCASARIAFGGILHAANSQYRCVDGR